MTAVPSRPACGARVVWLATSTQRACDRGCGNGVGNLAAVASLGATAVATAIPRHAATDSGLPGIVLEGTVASFYRKMCGTMGLVCVVRHGLIWGPAVS